MKTLMYIHGYGSTGEAFKAKELHAMFPDAPLVAPTFDYDSLSPNDVFAQLRALISDKKPDLVVGSSLGGYYALCCTSFFEGAVWCVNPVRDILATLQRLGADKAAADLIEQRTKEYRDFDQTVFQQLNPRTGQLHFALSTDDELLGDHRPLLTLFPNYGGVVWKDHCGHRFLRFNELKEEIAHSLIVFDKPGVAKVERETNLFDSPKPGNVDEVNADKLACMLRRENDGCEETNQKPL